MVMLCMLYYYGDPTLPQADYSRVLQEVRICIIMSYGMDILSALVTLKRLFFLLYSCGNAASATPALKKNPHALSNKKS